MNARDGAMRAAAVARFRRDLDRTIACAPGGVALPDDGRIALAVSGGADSMAMLWLAAAALPGRVIAATFDHALRAGSADEARLVADACAMIDLPHCTLTPDMPIAGSSIQMRARTARYAALTQWAAAAGARVLMTAHHADDQAETLLMRLNRASGLAGLSAIRAARSEGETMILRPLLGWRRAELRAIVEECGVPFVDDPSNRDARHDRTHVRALLAATPALDVAALAASAGFIAQGEEVVAHAADRAWRARWHGADSGFVIDDLPRELRRRLVRRAIVAVRETLDIALPVFTNATNIEPLLDALEAGRGAVQSGVKVAVTRAGLIFGHAPPRRST